ncbi:hypothetical protein ACPCK2_29475 [Streptomyces pseudogriseolus]|uniref:hypothetical protein n=1 Tax=Streptomyces pseudogriseolus TaxID=36817 RepID=UPI003FA310E8
MLVDAAVDAGRDEPGCPGARGKVRLQDRGGEQAARVPLGDWLPNRPDEPLDGIVDGIAPTLKL